ncbi:MAG TPA: chitobiase/beta-hexosaminidase C-terminal domain-containing protein, partial [Chitinophagaceae bacterium]|nr:chitobiase/beta-hexosaminidase C-terminal domain-containing protein [Chitinophagaceae bacterium]
LNSIKKQIVSLSLNKLPVKDEDLKNIKQFENIRKLELNFTGITAKGIKELTSLKHLHTLTLSGTELNYQDIKDQIPVFKSLKTVAVSNTGLSDAEAKQLQKDNRHVEIIAGFKDYGKDTLTLNPPQVKSDIMVFDQQLALQLKHPVKGVQIRYTADGTIPDSGKSPVFDNTTILDKTTCIKAKAYKDGWHSSDIATFYFYKNSFKPDSVQLLFSLNNVHQADGASTFFDKKLGTIGANDPAWANNWAGVKNNDMAIISLFKIPVTISSVGLHYMSEEVVGIFPPAVVEVWGGENEKQLKLLVKIKPSLAAKGDKPSLKVAEGQFKPQTVSCLKIIARPWRNKGNNYLLLVDEMFIN